MDGRRSLYLIALLVAALLFGPAVVSHTCANDGVVEGVRLGDGRAFSVQYHPEAAAGPHDAEYLFDQFVDLMASLSNGGGR